MQNPEILGIQAFHGGVALTKWWQWTLVAIIGASGVTGMLAFMWYSYVSIRILFKSSQEDHTLPQSVQERIHLLSRSSNVVRKFHTLPSKPSSFGVYLGLLSNPVTIKEARLLSQWEAVVLDYSAPGVLEAVSNGIPLLGPHIIARLDLPEIIQSAAMETELEMSRTITIISWTVQQTLRQANKGQYFTGVLMAGWRELISIPLLNGLARLLSAYGLHVFLELGPPDFLDDVENLDFALFAGLIVRNGTILANGERRDFFDMDKMRTTTKAFFSQACQRSFITLMWDTINDGADLSHAVLRRAHMWCRYHGAIPFFTSRSALTDLHDVRSFQEPLAAFQWLKDRRVMGVHDKYRVTRTLSQGSCSVISDNDSLQKIFPLLARTITMVDTNSDHEDTPGISTLNMQYTEVHESSVPLPTSHDSFMSPGLDWIMAVKRKRDNPLSCSFNGSIYKSLGCFPVGLHASKQDFDAVVQSQGRLRDLKLLERLSTEELHAASITLYGYACGGEEILDAIPKLRQAVSEIAAALAQTSDNLDDLCQLQVFRGLNSGFHTPTSTQFWAVWEVEPRSQACIIYLSKSVHEISAVLLHTYLSKLGFSRYHCFLAEHSLNMYDDSSALAKTLPRRLAQDLALLSPSDILLYLQHLEQSEWDKSCPLLFAIREQCETILIEVPTYHQFKKLSNMDYISGAITDEQLVKAKLKWYRLSGLPVLDQEAALELFRHVALIFHNILWQRDNGKLDALTSAIEKIASDETMGSVADFVLFALFCVARTTSFEEVYIEVSDRNPLFNQYPDQSAAFAELFALGSRCEAYFDIKPSDIGILLSKKHRDHYNQAENQPPMWIFNAPSFASAYAAAQTDIDPKQTASIMPAYRKFTFLSVFAIPALVDIVLLSTVGRGLYLSTRMSEAELRYATLALMCSLLISGAIGTWISIGGTYYLISMAFSAANMFVLTRLIGGLALTFAGCVVGFVIISAAIGSEEAAVFFFYLLGLTTYLSVLAVLSTYQIPGSSFLNGRKVIIMVIPTLIISPVLTMLIPHHDIYIYLGILYVFDTLLILGTRRIATQWVTWYHDIRTLNDVDVKNWYIEQHQDRSHTSKKGVSGTKQPDESQKILIAENNTITPLERLFSDPGNFQDLSEPAILALCRQALYDAVNRENHRRFWQKRTEDTLVKCLSDCWESTLFLLDWYCRITDTKRPIPYSSTWNLESQVALESMQQSQKGIRVHNSFIHWRTAGDEIYCGILYFVVALMDRWLDLVHGGRMIGLGGDSSNDTLRLSVGFGLAYYLIGAVLLDYKAQHLHTLSEQMSPISIKNISEIKQAKSNDMRFRRHLYFDTLCRFIGIHVWALALCATLIWIFNGSSTGVTMFLAYVGAYSGLLLYQYNKIFSGPHVLIPLLAAVALGIILGIILMASFPSFPYVKVIALAASTWTAALLSFRSAKLGLPGIVEYSIWIHESLQCLRRHERVSKLTKSENITELPSQLNSHCLATEGYHGYYGDGSNEDLSQSELQSLCDKLRACLKEDRSRLHPTGALGDSITAIFLSCTHKNLSAKAIQAFPMMPSLMQSVVLAWKDGRVKVFIVPVIVVADARTNLRAVSYYEKGFLILYFASDLGDPMSRRTNVCSDSMLIAETMLHACMETMFGVPHLHAEIAESMLSCREIGQQGYTASESGKSSIPASRQGSEALIFETVCRKTLLQHLCLGSDCDTQWDVLPLDIRRLFLRRCLGERHPYTETELSWINENVPAEDSCTILTCIARHDLGASLAISKLNYSLTQDDHTLTKGYHRKCTPDVQTAHQPTLNRSTFSIVRVFTEYYRVPLACPYHTLGTWVKFFVLACMADPEYQRELNGALAHVSRMIATPATFILTGIWIYSRYIMSCVIPFFLYNRRKDIAGLAGTVKGSLVVQKKDRIIIRSYGDTETAFIHPMNNSKFKLVFYQGALDQEPGLGVKRVTQYDKEMQMTQRHEYKNGKVAQEFAYEYASQRSQRKMQISRVRNVGIPLSRTCVSGGDEGSKVVYNRKGHIESGSYISHENLVRFKYHYRKNAKFDDELLRAEFVLPHMSVNVSWCAPPVRHAEKMERWIPTPLVYEATFVRGADVYECSWLYDHKFHPIITSKLNGEFVDTPDMIRYDWLGVLKKPVRCTFTNENPLLGFKSPTSSLMSRLLRSNIKRQEISTSRARSQLWKTWKQRNDLDGVLIRWVDEELIRKEPLLRSYWRRRDRGSLGKAEDYLALHADAIMASSDLTSDISAWTPLAIRMSDLFSFGQGGDAVIFTRTKTLQRDTESTLHVIAVDTGTWPNEGGGVSACRRDLINNLRTIKWHMVVESANDFGLPKHQTEENVESLKIIPLWGLDFMHPTHGMFINKLDSEVDHLIKEATKIDIKINFIPTLTALVRGARAINMTAADIKQATRALLSLNTYFQNSRHWKEIWTSDLVKDTWRELWLADDMPNAQPPSEWFCTELPTLGHFDTALELWFRYLFIFSIPIPEQVPHVFQASHHSVSAAYGIICKLKRNCSLQIWDHAISWRETNLYLSSAMCTLPPFIRNSLLGLMRMTSCLILHHADQILPCADFFNPGWEVEIGSGKGQLTHRNVFRRKVDPIVNGITDMQKFSPIIEIKTRRPTVTMLSHVWFAKDIKTALLAADIITNEWGFKDYQLDIYGALNKSPVYSSECQEILACKGLGPNVTMRGTADPAMVLADSWLFLNSSVSEGLPLALGEAALTGVPVVCTDVGASLRVLTDPDDGKRYSEVVAPNDAYGLARAQINLLAMLDEWAQYAGDSTDIAAPVLPHKPTLEDVRIITQRMYEKTEHRRRLGMMARNIVQKSFGGERYLREHEQMLWIGKACYEMLGLKKFSLPPRNPAPSSNCVDTQTEKMIHPPRRIAPQLTSTATSFSSVYIDEPSSSSTYSDPVEENEEWDAHSRNTAIKHSIAANHEWPLSLIVRPSRVYNGTQMSTPATPSPTIRSQSAVHPAHSNHESDYGFHDISLAPKGSLRKATTIQRGITGYDGRGSTVRTRSYLNEMELMECE